MVEPKCYITKGNVPYMARSQVGLSYILSMLNAGKEYVR
jgi:hypothetical protein